MHRTRRTLPRRLLLGALAMPFVATRHAAAQLQAPQSIAPPVPVVPGVPATGLPATGLPAPGDIRTTLRAARQALPAASQRGRTALDRTLERVEEFGLAPLLAPDAGRLVLVNIPAAELIAYDAGREVLRSRIVVGTSRTRTPQLATFVTSVRSNPPWYVPASIEPEIRATGAAGFRTVNGRLVQPPGPTNPLGPLRIGLLDSDGIFLHGTNSPGLFNRTDRALSHGCVRVERIRDLAAWALGTTASAVATSLATGRTLELVPPQDIQVALAYLTAWPDALGRVTAHADPYGLDLPGTRRIPIRRINRPVAQPPAEAEAAARGTTPEDNPL